MHSHHDKTRGWRPFWAALGAALLVLLPLVGGTILLTRQSLRTKLAAKPQSGVAVRMPKTENQLTLLVCTAGEQPGFVLRFLPELERAHARHRAQQLPDNITVDQHAVVPQKQIIFSPLDMRE